MSVRFARPRSLGGAGPPVNEIGRLPLGGGDSPKKINQQQRPRFNQSLTEAQALTQRQRLITRIRTSIPRVVRDLIDENDRYYHLGAGLDTWLAKYAALDAEMLGALGGDRFAAVPLRHRRGSVMSRRVRAIVPPMKALRPRRGGHGSTRLRSPGISRRLATRGSQGAAIGQVMVLHCWGGWITACRGIDNSSAFPCSFLIEGGCRGRSDVGSAYSTRAGCLS
jgi:hypothetical protein